MPAIADAPPDALPITAGDEPGTVEFPESPLLRALSSVSCFEALSEEALRSMAHSAIHLRYDAGQVVLVEGEPCTGLYVVESGCLKEVRYSAAGREQVIRTLEPGEHFNEISVFAEMPNTVTAVALEPSVVWLVPAGTVLDFLEWYPTLARTVTRSLAREVLHMVEMVEDLSMRSVEARLARRLLASPDGEEPSGLKRARWATQAELASQLGTVPDVLNRVLRRLARDGLIEVHRQEIKVLDAEKLEERAESKS